MWWFKIKCSVLFRGLLFRVLHGKALTGKERQFCEWWRAMKGFRLLWACHRRSSELRTTHCPLMGLIYAISACVVFVNGTQNYPSHSSNGLFSSPWSRRESLGLKVSSRCLILLENFEVTFLAPEFVKMRWFSFTGGANDIQRNDDSCTLHLTWYRF